MAADSRVEFDVRIGIGHDLRELADTHVRELGFLEIRFDPHRAALDEAEDLRALLHVFADLELHVADHAVGRRRHLAARQIDLRRVVRGLRLRRSADAAPPAVADLRARPASTRLVLS